MMARSIVPAAASLGLFAFLVGRLWVLAAPRYGRRWARWAPVLTLPVALLGFGVAHLVDAARPSPTRHAPRA